MTKCRTVYRGSEHCNRPGGPDSDPLSAQRCEMCAQRVRGVLCNSRVKLYRNYAVRNAERLEFNNIRHKAQQARLCQRYFALRESGHYTDARGKCMRLEHISNGAHLHANLTHHSSAVCSKHSTTKLSHGRRDVQCSYMAGRRRSGPFRIAEEDTAHKRVRNGPGCTLSQHSTTAAVTTVARTLARKPTSRPVKSLDRGTLGSTIIALHVLAQLIIGHSCTCTHAECLTANTCSHTYARTHAHTHASTYARQARPGQAKQTAPNTVQPI